MTIAVAFDFAARRIEAIDPEDVLGAIAAGKFCWIDIDQPGESAAMLDGFGIDSTTIDRVVEESPQGQYRLAQNCIHCTLVETGLAGDDLKLNALHLVIGEGFLATVHAHPSTVLEQVRETSTDDFRAMAQTGGFLLFEIVDHLIGGYRATLAQLSRGVEEIQEELLGDVGDEILAEVSELTRSLLNYRNAVVSARETIHELATRRSAYVSPTTQPFLDRQTVSLERLTADAATERTVLSETLALYMGVVSHRTNKIINRLTIVSLVFLPLNFLAAVYGMNFEHMPELSWRYGYYGFWATSAALVFFLLFSLRRRRWV